VVVDKPDTTKPASIPDQLKDIQTSLTDIKSRLDALEKKTAKLTPNP
jgi:hypothetical protein